MTQRDPHGPRVCWVGSHGKSRAGYPSVARVLQSCLGEAGIELHLTSTRTSRLRKLWDIYWTLASKRSRFDTVVVDVFSTAAFRYAELASRLAKRRGSRLILVLHGGGLPDLVKRAPQRVEALLTRADQVIAPSAYLAREVGERLGVSVEVIENPVDLSLFNGRVRDTCRPKLIWVRAFRAVYRPDVAVRTVAALRERGIEAHLTMVGPERDGALARTRRLAAEESVADLISFLGLCTRRQVAEMEAEADVFLNTTSVDNTPLSVIEAMAGGLIVVSSAVGGLPDLLEDGRDALLVPEQETGDDLAVAFATAIQRVVETPALASRLSEAARTKAQSFDLAVVGARWAHLLDRESAAVRPTASRSALPCA